VPRPVVIAELTTNPAVIFRYKPKLRTNKLDAPRQAEKCRSLRVKAKPRFRPSVASAPASRRDAAVASAPESLPAHTPFLPKLPSAPSSLPPQAPFRPRLPSAPDPPTVTPGPQLALRACVRVLGVSEYSPAEAKCGCAVRVSWLTSTQGHGACAAVRRLPDSSAAELPGGTSLRWSTPSIAPTANDLRQELELTRFQVDRGSYA
jgi:hypothetical protein